MPVLTKKKLSPNQFSNNAGILAALQRAMKFLVPAREMLPSVWAEENVRIPIGNAIPGPINFANAPYQRGMIDVIKQPGIRRVSYKMAAQTGKTTIQQCITGYFVAHEPRSQMFVQPTEGDVQTFRETKLMPMFEANPSIKAKIAKQRSRDGVNNRRMISYYGGWLMFSWAGSPKTLRGRSAPVTQADEIDGYEATPEGDPGELLAQRSATFGDMSLRTESSTPTVKGASRIDVAYEEGDQREYYVACPDCDEPQTFKWENVRWDGRVSTNIDDWENDLNKEHLPETAMYCCHHCGSLWDDGQRIAAIRNAESKGFGWKAGKPFRGHASFTGTEMLSTFRKLRDIAQSYLDKIALGDMQSFVNVSLGLSYEENGDKVDPDSLVSRARMSTYIEGQVPEGVLYITAGIDMQMDRLEVEIVGWGIGFQSWSVDYRVLWGDVQAPDVWEELEALLDEEFEHEYGVTMPISAACLDTGGTNGMTQAAYDFCKGKTGRRLFAIKGVSGWSIPVVQSPQRKQTGKNARRVDLFLVAVDETKLLVTRRLSVAQPGPGYCHFPNDRDDDWFKQVTAEKLLTRYIKGQPVREWHKHNKTRNEGLDCRVYATAAICITQPSFKKLEEKLQPLRNMAQKQVKQLPKVEEREIPSEEQSQPVTENKVKFQPQRTLKRSSSRGNWAKNW